MESTKELADMATVAGHIGPKPEQQGNITIDQPSRLVIVEQRPNQFALKPDVVKLPFDTLKIIAAQLTLLDAGMMQIAPGGTSQVPG